MTTKAKFIPLGFIQKAHGLKGEVLVVLDSKESLEPFPKILYAGSKSSSEENLQSLEVSGTRWADKGLIVQFQSYEQRSQAETLKGLTLYFEAFQSEHFHLFEVLNFLVQVQMEKELKSLGRVSHFLSHSHQDLLVVKGSPSEKPSHDEARYSMSKQVEIPFVSSYIQSINFKEKKIILKLPKGFPGVDDEYEV